MYRFLKFEKSDMELLKAKGYEIHTGANMYEAEWLQDDGSLDDLEIHKHQIDFGRSPFSSKSLKAYKQLKNFLRRSSLKFFTAIHQLRQQFREWLQENTIKRE